MRVARDAQLPQRLVRAVVRRAHNPIGAAGHLERWLCADRPSNVSHNWWAVDLLE
jgi:hypothetical protein